MYNDIFELHAQLLKALSHPKRLEIIHLIRDQELPVSDIYTMLDLPQANISQHLMVLRDAGIVVARREGKQIYYSLSNNKIIKANDLLRTVLAEQHHDDQCPNESMLKINELVPLVHDPVCMMRLSPKTASYHHQHKDKTYYFCASGCMKKFKDNPKKFINSHSER